ncbi:hypothetical protein AB3R30_17715 [Leptolyngbyaceae cyanobacterium UHCC 1019]
MVEQSLSLPIEPFQRLQVNDGLLLTAERWRLAHEYHRKRQNVHYQSLNQAGIVSGLGVCLIAAPDEIATEHRDGRWLQIQQGVAIDGYGNPIVVPQAIAFRIASPAPLSGSLTIYITLRYVDPDRLQGQGDRDLVQETFRIDETSTLPSRDEVELCRVQLIPGEVRLLPAADVLNPIANTLDLRYRQWAQARPIQQVCLAQVLTKAASQMDETVAYSLQSLVRSLPAQYPIMEGTMIAPINLAVADAVSFPADLLYFTRQQFLTLDAAEKQTLQRHVATGTVILIETSLEESEIAELGLIRQQLQTAIASFAQETNAAQMQRDLEVELAAVEAALNRQIQDLLVTVQAIAQEIGITTDSTGTLGRDHPLRSPFLFAQFPSIEGYPVHLFNWGSIVLSIGSLSQAWGLDEALSLTRETIRTAQEIGINLLHFSWKRRQLTQLQMSAEF